MKHWSSYTFIIFALLITLAVAGNIPGTYNPLRPNDTRTDQNDPHVLLNTAGDPRLSDQTAQHILYGNDRGGGHHHSADKPCKSEFPESWNAEKIIRTVTELAANDNAAWRREDNGYYVAEQPYEELKIRVVLDREGDDIVTAYPTNVTRNPCE